jgi:hypothetical protein
MVVQTSRNSSHCLHNTETYFHRSNSNFNNSDYTALNVKAVSGKQTENKLVGSDHGLVVGIVTGYRLEDLGVGVRAP